MTADVLHADLCIVGAGYAGVCAYDAAVQYLAPGARVVVVDPNTQWGGQWIHQYDFVRLHQPYRIFTAGARKWAINKPDHYLATKPEILSHLRGCVKAATEESKVELIELFGMKYTGHEVLGDVVEIQCCLAEGEAGGAHVDVDIVSPRLVTVRAGRLIKAMGLNVAIKKPLAVSSPHVHSISPKDVLMPKWKNAMRFSDKPIIVIGSGKTAMDCINHLADAGFGDGPAGPRLGCVAGRGTWFINRDVAFPRSFAARHFRGKTIIRWFAEMMQMHDGDNEREVYSEFAQRGFLHSPIEGASIFGLGFLSEAETSSVRVALGDRVIKGRLMDVLQLPGDDEGDEDGDEGSPVLRIRGLDGTTVTDHPIPAGSFIVNATDSLFTPDKINNFDPILDASGLVCNAQMAFVFTGPGSDIVVHSFFLGTLDHYWRDLVRGELVTEKKHKGGMTLIYLLVVNMVYALRHLPARIVATRKHLPTSIVPLHRLAVDLGAVLWNLNFYKAKAQQEVPGRYTDDHPLLDTAPVASFLDKTAAGVDIVRRVTGTSVADDMGGAEGMGSLGMGSSLDLLRRWEHLLEQSIRGPQSGGGIGDPDKGQLGSPGVMDAPSLVVSPVAGKSRL